MRLAARIFLRDLKRIATNGVAIIIALGVCIIPSLYAWVNILANWDPYKNTSTVPIAVVIQDKGANVADLGYTNAGDMMREELKKNDQLGWTFVGKKQALDGVKRGTYYAAFIIPEDFTASVADVLEGNTEQARIDYYVNEKVNAISPKVTDTGSTTLESQISSKFVAMVGKTITEKLQAGARTTAGKLDAARDDATGKLYTAEADVNDLADGLTRAQGTIAQARTTVSQARDTLKKIKGTGETLDQALSSSMDTLATTRAKTRSLSAQLSGAIGTSTSTLSDISAQAAYDIGRVSGSIGWATGKIDAAIAQLRSLNNTVQTMKGTLETTRTTLVRLKLTDSQAIEFRDQATNSIDADLSHLVQLSQGQLAQLDRLQRLSDQIKAGNSAVSGLTTSVNDAIQINTRALNQLQSELASTTMPQVSGALDDFADAGGTLVGTVGTLSPMLAQADGTLAQLDRILAQSATTVGNTANSLHRAAGDIGTLADNVSAIQSAANLSAIKRTLGLDATEVGDFMGSPVTLKTDPVFPVKNYGSGVTPFYTNLALWVGGFVLVAIYKLEVDREGIGDFKPWQGFFGRWLLLNLLGQVQALICCIGDIALGIQCDNPVAFVFAGMVASFVYVFFVYAISVAFKHIGKALGVLLVVLQIPGTSGVYPIEMMPDFFQALRPWLPFTYGINAMREAIAGFYGNAYGFNLAMLAVYLIPALLIGVTARRYLLNVNTLFDRKLGETDLMITERTGLTQTNFRLTTLIKIAMAQGSYKQVFLARAAAFELAYPVLVRRGFAALIIVPLVFLALLFILPAKYLFLILWIISLVVICTYLIVVEYLHSRVAEKTALTDMDRTALYRMLDTKLREEFMAFAPIEKLVLDRASAEAQAAAPTDAESTGRSSGPNGATPEAPASKAAAPKPAAPTSADLAPTATDDRNRPEKGGDAHE